MNQNAEAGPSKPRSAPTRPVPDPPPATPPSTAKSVKRRSWFDLGIGSPSVISSPSTHNESPTRKERERRKSNSSNISTRSNAEDVGLAPVISDNTSNGEAGGLFDRLSSESARKQSQEEGYDHDEEELLTIDGDPEKTVKKKKKRKSKGHEDDFEVMRMNDLGSSYKGLGMKQQTPRTSSDRTIKPDISDQNTPQQTQSFSIRTRTFSRTASDRDPFSPPEYSSQTPKPAPRSSSTSLKDQRPNIKQRTSSIPSLSTPSNPNSQTPSPRISSLHIDKSQPPIPIDFDRPLPPIPPIPPLPTDNSQSSISSLKPEIPRGIVVTPSSPRKLSKTPKKPPLTQRRSRSANGYARDSATGSQQQKQQNKRSQSRDGASNSNSSSTPNGKIGLGLPSALLPTSRGNTDSPPPPPVPAKNQSVSSPFPTSRSPSPIPKIAFVEPDGLPQKSSDEHQPEEKRKVVRRARSLSGFFGKTPPVIHNSEVEDHSSVTLEAKQANLGESISKSSGGVLEWLGVRKTVKRKTSDAQLKIQAGEQPNPTIDLNKSDVDLIQGPVKSGSMENLDSPRQTSNEFYGSQQPTPRKPQYNLSTKSTTSMPTTGQSKISSIFNRRTSAKTTDDESEPPSVQVVPMAIPNAGMRNHTARSSASSFNLPTHDPISPFIPESGPWVSTPQSEKEETLFSPPEGSNWGPGRRPWMDGGERHNSSRSSISSPLDSLPEQGIPQLSASPLKAPPKFKEGRVRSWSDAPLPPQKLVTQSSNPHLPLPRPSTPNSQSPSLSLSSSPQTPSSRPKLGDRSNSGNSAIIGRMRSVFSKSTNRSRSSSLLRKGSSEIDEFGNIPPGLIGEFGKSQRMRPSTSSSSMGSSTAALRGRSIGEDNARPSTSSGTGIGLEGNIDQTRSPRTSFTPSMSSLGSKPEVPLQQETKTARKNRVRASTISLAPTAYPFVPPNRPSSPNLFPIAATPPRRRPGTIHRISNGLFGGSGNSSSIGPSSPKNNSSSLFPLPPRSSGGSLSSSTTFNTTGQGGGVAWEDGSNSYTTTNGFLSPGTSPRPSTGSLSATTTTMSNSLMKQLSQRENEESPNQWLDRIVNNVGRNEIANVLASSGDEFYLEALRLYMATFDFTHNALDVALRRLLMHMSLPKETQQIDRVIEAFSRRYEECEPGLFGQKDNTYVLAFSMMMLHTDAFNKSNKNKMAKGDYVRNTRMEGVSPLVLEAFFDNITFTPFVFIEDDTDLKRSSGYESSSSTFGPSTPTFSAPIHNAISGTATSVSTGNGNLPIPIPLPSSKSKIDVYHMIVRGLLGTLRVENIENQVPIDSPFSFMGTRPFLDLDYLCQAFANSHNLIIPSHITSNSNSINNSRRVVPGKLTTPARRYTVGAKDQEKVEDLVLRVVKVGLLSRKDDTDQTSKKASRKWKSWSVILTSSQLLFFKDPTWALTLLEQIQSLQNTNAGQLLLPRQTSFKPDEVFSLKDCVAVYDRTFTAYPNTFRFVMPQSRQYLLQSSDEFEMNEWITLINYASTFKTVDIKMKGPTMRKDQVVLAGAAAAASHKRELRGAGGGNQQSVGSGKKAIFGDSNGLGLGLFDGPPSPHINEHLTASIKAKHGNVNVEEGGNEVVHEGEQLEEVFGVVKAELAAGRGEAGSVNHQQIHSLSTSVPPSQGLPTNEKQHIYTSRVSAIYEHLAKLRKQCIPIEESLKSSLLSMRNISILTPYQKSTRDRLSSSIPPLAHKIRSDRLQLTKLKLWIKVLEYEGEREDREWKVVRHVALQAAARSLREDTLDNVVKDINKESNGQGQKPSIPKLALPISDQTQQDHKREVNENHQRREEFTSPVELPEIIRRSSDEPSSTTSITGHHIGKTPNTINRDQHEQQIPRSSSMKLGVKMRKSNSASDLLNPQIRSRRSSEIEETTTTTTITNNNNTSKTPTNQNSPSNSLYDNIEDRDGNTPISVKSKSDNNGDTPMMLFTMESPLEIPSNSVPGQDESSNGVDENESASVDANGAGPTQS
ncbi:uncharacterized protein L201_007268 [Kwoniella dendrophila CBS 6074]|uniref:SEC7 domain-containing protein n=1 Tax=Kwoniella dendrophila CBS 6074 TaxID=1295534 RepID=A0AAX4K5B1_9TREE